MFNNDYNNNNNNSNSTYMNVLRRPIKNRTNKSRGIR